jgi:hypothetical protein
LESATHIIPDKEASASLWQRRGFRQFMLVVPALLALFVLFVYPLSSVLLRSLFSPDFTLEHYLYFFKTPLLSNCLCSAPRQTRHAQFFLTGDNPLLYDQPSGAQLFLDYRLAAQRCDQHGAHLLRADRHPF